MSHRVNTCTLVVGKKGSGKSTVARQLALAYPKRVYIDPMYEAKDGVIVRNYRDAVNYLQVVRVKPQYSLILRTMDVEDELRLVSLMVYGDPEHPMMPGALVYIDEMDRLQGPHFLPPAMDRLANYGRHFGVSIIGVARSPKQFHGDFRRAADVFYVGKLNEPADVDYLNEYTGSEFCAKARTLSEYQFIRWPETEGGPPPP